VLDVGCSCHSDPFTAIDRAIETGAGLCAHDSFHSLDRHFSLHTSHPEHDRMVGVAGLFNDTDVWIGHLGLSVERVETHDVWGECNEATGYGKSGEWECAGGSRGGA